MPDEGPTDQRLAHAKEPGSGGFKFFEEVGGAKKHRRYNLFDDALGRAWMRHWISSEEYYALGRYAQHWVAGGLQGGLQSADLDRVFAFNPMGMSGLAKTERQQDHRDAYRAAKVEIGRRPAFVADKVACQDFPLMQVGLMLGYRSEAHAREEARLILQDAGHRLSRFWKDRDR